MTKKLEFGLSDKEKSPTREALNKHDMGRKKYYSKIDKGEREAREKNLPFTFSKPKKASKVDVDCFCTHCKAYTRVTKNTIMVVCVSCKKLYSVTAENSSR